LKYRNNLTIRLFADKPAIVVDLRSEIEIAKAGLTPDVPEVAEQTLKMAAVMRQSTMDLSPTPSTSSAAAHTVLERS